VKAFWINLFLFILLINACSAASISITADYKHYDKYRDVLIAKGNVIVKGEDFVIESPYVIRHFKDEKIVAMDKFEFEREGYRISGSNLEYYYVQRSGNADKVRVNFGETFLGGRYMTISKDKFEIYDGYFTGCNEPTSHYHISAGQMVLYPKTGLIVAHYASCWIWMAPVIPVPTFVYSAPVPKTKFVATKKQAKPTKAAKAKMEGIKSTQPVPEIGSNPSDGWFLRQGFNWYFGPKQYLKFLLSYMEKKKFGLGIRTNYMLLNDLNEGEIRVSATEGDNGFWGATHYMSFGPKLLSKADEEWLVYDFYQPGGKYSYELETKYSYRERINYDKNIGPFGRVSFTPNVTFRSNRKPLPYLGDPFTYFWEAGHGNVSEEVNDFDSPSEEAYTTSSTRTNSYLDAMYTNDFGWLGKFNAAVDLTLTDYGKLGSWDRSRQKMSLAQGFFDRLYLEYGHTHYIMQRGKTPYLFEGYYYSPYDQFFGSLTVKAWFSSFQIRTSYNLPSWDPFSISYQWIFGLHCYDLIFEYEVLRKEFLFNLELTPSRW